jgi:hypothetical protein
MQKLYLQAKKGEAQLIELPDFIFQLKDTD